MYYGDSLAFDKENQVLWSNLFLSFWYVNLCLFCNVLNFDNLIWNFDNLIWIFHGVIVHTCKKFVSSGCLHYHLVHLIEIRLFPC